MKSTKSTTQTILECILGGGIFISGIIVMIYGIRMFSAAATPITVHEVKPGIYCATMVTGDGAAIDCWKDDK